MKYCEVKLFILSVFIIAAGNLTSVYCLAAAAADKTQLQIRLLAPGYGELDFVAPEAGSYQLPVLGEAHNARVLNTDGDFVEFHQLFKGKYTLLNFMYSQCNDINGCPLSHVVFNRIRQLASQDPEINQQLRFISMSFDPENDRPEVLKAISDALEGHGAHGPHQMKSRHQIEWLYLTTDSQQSLRPILDNYNQAVQQQFADDGKAGGSFSHILRVFLIDPENKIRNIYSVSFLHPEIIINDVKTLLMARKSNDQRANHAQNHILSNKPRGRIGPGDHKGGYHSTDYKTRSVSLTSRQGLRTNLLQLVENPPLGLPKVPVPSDNPMSEAKIQLGKKLFFDRRLSLNNTISCAMCHIPEQGFTNNELKTPVGFEGRSVRRNAPTLYNSAYLQKLHHDARETSLENQIWQPLMARNEMAMPSIGMVVKKIRALADYQGLFEHVFNGKKANVVTIGQAIASYERTLISANSAFDRWYFAKEEHAISASAKRGFTLFSGKAQCIVCHSVNSRHALFSDNKLHNTGIGWQSAMKKAPQSERVQVAPGQYISVKQSVIKSVGLGPVGDLGHYEITQQPADRWRYRTSSLRNITLTAPYMHDGSLSTLEDVVNFYNQGGFKNNTQSPLIRPLNLSPGESQDLIAFLKTLTGSNVKTLVSDAFATPVGNTHD